MSLLRDLPPPSVVEELDYETIVERKLSDFTAQLAAKGITYVPSEADDVMTMIELDAYEEMQLRAQINARIKQMFLAYATGSNLDHIGTTRFGVVRLEGKKPRATVRFTLSQAQRTDIVIPAGLLLGDGGHTATLTQSVVIRAGETEADGVSELDIFVRESDVRCETILTPLPWVVEATQITPFEGGANKEDDERYRDRIWLSRDRRSTAGSLAMYAYYAKSADVRVAEVTVLEGNRGEVRVVVLGENYTTTQDMLSAVETALNKDEVRPLTDRVLVEPANVRSVRIDATLIAHDVSLVDVSSVATRFDAYEGRFGASLSVPKIYDLLIDKNIADVILREPTQSVEAAPNEVLRFDVALSVEAVQ